MVEQVGGWWWPGDSRKAHFFALDSRSLCGRWACIGYDPRTFPLADGPGPDDCAACWKKKPPTAQPVEEDIGD